MSRNHHHLGIDPNTSKSWFCWFILKFLSFTFGLSLICVAFIYFIFAFFAEDLGVILMWLFATSFLMSGCKFLWLMCFTLHSHPWSSLFNVIKGHFILAVVLRSLTIYINIVGSLIVTAVILNRYYPQNQALSEVPIMRLILRIIQGGKLEDRKMCWFILYLWFKTVTSEDTASMPYLSKQ